MQELLAFGGSPVVLPNTHGLIGGPHSSRAKCRNQRHILAKYDDQPVVQLTEGSGDAMQRQELRIAADDRKHEWQIVTRRRQSTAAQFHRNYSRPLVERHMIPVDYQRSIRQICRSPYVETTISLPLVGMIGIAADRCHCWYREYRLLICEWFGNSCSCQIERNAPATIGQIGTVVRHRGSEWLVGASLRDWAVGCAKGPLRGSSPFGLPSLAQRLPRCRESRFPKCTRRQRR